MPEADAVKEAMSQGLTDSLSAQSNSETETIRNSKSSDVDNQIQSDGQENVPSLIQMYKQKYPDSSFDILLTDSQQNQETKTDLSNDLGETSSENEVVRGPEQSINPSLNVAQDSSLENENNPHTVLKALEEVNSEIHSKLKSSGEKTEISFTRSPVLDHQTEKEIGKLKDNSSDQGKSQCLLDNQAESLDPKSSAYPSDISNSISVDVLNGSPNLNLLSTCGEASRSSSGKSHSSAFAFNCLFMCFLF